MLIAEEMRQNKAARVEDATALYTGKGKGKQYPKKQLGRRTKDHHGPAITLARFDTTLENVAPVEGQGSVEKREGRMTAVWIAR
uniref:Uncharacterized protein n=1 Tax=Peronospora matthiolae TaxID=2874970 RepID=A0AAV1UTR7_9STRA